MDFLELRDTVRDFCRVGGFADGDPPPDWARLINEAYREIGTETEYNWEDLNTITTTANTAEYSLTTSSDLRDWIRVTDVLYGTTKRLYLSSELEERTLNSLWTQASAGTPGRWWISKPNTIRLHPKPDTSSVTLYIHGCRNPAELTADTDTPTMPTRYHEAIPLRAAWNHLRRIASGDEYVRAGNYRDEAKALVNQFKSQLTEQRRIIKRNMRPEAGRLLLGGYYPVRGY